jgi:hypothetical protein
LLTVEKTGDDFFAMLAGVVEHEREQAHPKQPQATVPNLARPANTH